MRYSRAMATILLSLACAIATHQAQETTSTLRGKVLDPQNAPLPGVPVRISRSSRVEAARSVVTDLSGRFRFSFLPPATDYLLFIDYPGFASTKVGPIHLNAGRTTVQDVTLQTTDDLTERVEVTAHGSVVDTESTKTSTSFNTEFIEGLPIIGRNYQDILTLTPGVTDTDGDGNPNVQGARETGLQYRLDGGNITDPSSGTYGQNLNIDAIEEIEVITAGAGAEFGRADGGFANIITKSGSNDFEGTFRLVWRGEFLDGDGALENEDTFTHNAETLIDLQDVSSYLTLGGPLKRDKLWYFASFQDIKREVPLNLAGLTIDREVTGRTLFGKLTWQLNPNHKMALQYSDDPSEFTGTFLDFGIDEESDAVLKRGGRTLQLRWTAITSPTLLLETLLTHFDSGVAVTPVSDAFHETQINTTVVRSSTGQVSIQAFMPRRECSKDGKGHGWVPNCDPRWGRTTIYQVDTLRGTASGPFPSKTDDERTRSSIQSSLTYTLEDAWGEHQIKAGFEFAEEAFRDEPINNPVFVNQVTPLGCCVGDPNLPARSRVTGFKFLLTPTPVRLDQDVESFNSSFYVQDSWKPRPNLAVHAGFRIDREDIDTAGFAFFDPREEKRKSIAIIEGLCSDALRVSRMGGLSNADSVCDEASRIPGNPPVGGPLVYTFDSLSPETLRDFDGNEDGIFDSGSSDGSVWLDPFTNFPDRLPETFEIDNLNLSPRFSISWDPGTDGKTKLFGTWGRYYDRLFLDTVDDEMGPDTVNYVFATTFIFSPGQVSSASSKASVTQIDRDLRTPFTDVFTMGVERELAPEWSVKATYTQRLGWDLLQDGDVNHVLCREYPIEFNIKATQVCPLFTDSTGKIHVSDDLFGGLQAGLDPFTRLPIVQSAGPNGVPDLYSVNGNFTQVLRITNANSSKYRSLTLELLRRLHRNWQAQLSYTYSRVFGQAEEFASVLGNDPATTDDEEGPLDYDQRHRVILIATSHLPRDVELGTSIIWESGTPYSAIIQAADQDSAGSVSIRTVFPTGQRNDQRNNGFWGVDLKLVKRFQIGNTAASAGLAVKNLLNDDDLTIGAFRSASVTGVQLEQGPQGLRRFGRFWELGFTLAF